MAEAPARAAEVPPLLDCPFQRPNTTSVQRFVKKTRQLNGQDKVNLEVVPVLFGGLPGCWNVEATGTQVQV